MKQDKKSFIRIIEIAAAIITLFGFITGWQSIRQFFESVFPASKSIVPLPSPIPSSTFTNISPTIMETPTSTSEPLASATFGLPINVSSQYPIYPGLELKMRPSEMTGFKLILKIPGSGLIAQQLLQESKFQVYLAVLDITNQWAVVQDKNVDAGGNYYFQLDSNGTASFELPAGDYALIGPGLYRHISGCDWIQYHFSGGGGSGTAVVFPIQQGYITEIILTLSRLEIGLVNNNGKIFLSQGILIDCEGKDINGNPIIVYPQTENGGPWQEISQDNTGLVTFFLAPGNYSYSVCYENIGYIPTYGITLNPAEVKRIIVTKDNFCSNP